MYAVIFAGGAGTRLWPLSRQRQPKQLHPLVSHRALLVESVERLLPIIPKDHLLIQTTRKLLGACRRELPAIPRENFIVEPSQRNTGPAVGLAATLLHKRDKDAIIAALWSDHHIGRPEEFRKVLLTAERVITKHPQSLVTVGINPTEPSTAYGYIHMNTRSETVGQQRIFRVKRFVEKPDLSTAKRYVRSWRYLWNAGYFIFRAETMLDLMKRYAPGISRGLRAISDTFGTPKATTVLEREYLKFPNISIDYLIAEKAEEMYVVPADLEWSDIGTWASLHEILAIKGNTRVISKGHHVGHGDEDVLVYARDKLVATVGLKNVVVVDTPDALLVLNKDRAQDIRHLIEKLKSGGKSRYL